MDAASGELPCSLADLPEEAQRQLQLAGLAYQQDAVAELHLDEALRIAPEHLAVQVARYRYLFYKGRLKEALAQLDVCMGIAAERGGLPPDWRKATAQDARFGDFEALWPRFYMFALKAHAYLNLRLGDIEGGNLAAMQALQLDPADNVGAKLLLDVIERQGRDDYE